MTLQFHQAQKNITLDRHRFRVLCCGRRFGKTTLAIEEMKACASIPKKRICYIAPTYQQARDIAWADLKNQLKDVADFNESRLEIRVVNGSIIQLRGWEAVETLRGQKFDLIIIDEVAMMRNFWLQWQEVIRPTLTDTKGEGLFISTPKGFNHFYDLYNMQETDTDFKSYHFTTYDNPFVPSDEIDKASRELTEERFSQEYLADFRKTEGLVYKEFDRNRHLFNQENIKDIVFRELMIGVDFGFTNPCAVISICRDGSDTYYVTNEWYETGHTDVEVAEYIASLNPNRCFPDPEAPAAIAELKKRKVNVREVVKGKDSIKNGIDKVRELFKANKLKISSDCRNLIMELETYSYPDKKPDHNEQENPIDENNHALDALRYCIVMSSIQSLGFAQQYRPQLNSKNTVQVVRGGLSTAPQWRPNFKRGKI